MSQNQSKLETELTGYRNRLEEIHVHLGRLEDQAKELDSEADLMISVIGSIENRLIGHNVQYFGKCCCIACKEGIYD